MVLKKKNCYSITLIVVLALTFLITPILTGFSLANTIVQNDDKSTCKACVDKELIEFAKDKFGITTNVLSDDETKKYIDAVEKSPICKAEKFKFSNNVKAIYVKPLDIVQIMGQVKGSDNTVLAAFIDGVTGKITSITTLGWDGLENNNNVITTKYLDNGKKNVYLNSWKELKIKKAEKTQKLQDYKSHGGTQVAAIGDTKELLAIDWYYWCCQFASITACGAACLVFVEIPPLMATCDLMCNQIWSANLC